MAATNAVSWRSEGIFYRKNEVFLDVIESVNLLVCYIRFLVLPYPDAIQVNANGNVVRSEILGAVKMKCYLSGMPELRLGLNDKVMLETTGRSTSPRPLTPFTYLISSQHPAEKLSNLKTSNSINVSVSPASKTTA